MSAAQNRRLAAVPTVPPDGQGRAPTTSRTDEPTAADNGRAHGPYSRPPRTGTLLPAERQPMLAEALAGVRLGTFDRRAIDWLCRWVDTPTFLALLGLVHRARQAAVAGSAAADGQPAEPSPAPTRAHTARDPHPEPGEEQAP